MTGVELQNDFYIMFGFRTFKDFKSSLFGTWYKELTLAISILIGYVVFGIDIILNHVNTVWFNPAQVILLTIAIIIVDWIVGVYGAVITKKFETRKAQRLIPMLLANWLMLSGLYNINKFIVKPLDIELLTGSMDFFVLFAAFYLAAVHFISAVVNAGKAKLIDGKMVKFIMDYVDKRKAKIDDLID